VFFDIGPLELVALAVIAQLPDISMADLNPRTLVRKHLLEPVDLDETS
jgi:hypothetical protein